MKTKLLVICQPQFGYQIDYFNYCKYLHGEYDITYLCLDAGRDKYSTNDINVIYIEPSINRYFTNYKFLKIAINLIRKERYTLTLTYNFLGCSILPVVFNNSIIILDIRSGRVNKNVIRRTANNFILTLESCFYRNISIITDELRKTLKIPKKKAYILPLGSDKIDIERKIFSTKQYSLLYVGTFNNRNIHETIEGLAKYLKSDAGIDITYTIIGTGNKNEIQVIRNSIFNNRLTEVVQLLGYVKTTELIEYYKNALIGVSYIPITPYYDSQPPTKTYEYLQAGIPVLATATNANKDIINNRNGILTRDNPSDFAKGVKTIISKLSQYDSDIIKNTVSDNNWENIIDKLKDYLQKIC